MFNIVSLNSKRVHPKLMFRLKTVDEELSIHSDEYRKLRKISYIIYENYTPLITEQIAKEYVMIG